MVGCYGWVSPRLSGLRLSKHTNRPPSLLLLRGTAWVYPSVERAGRLGVGGGEEEGRKSERRDRGRGNQAGRQAARSREERRKWKMVEEGKMRALQIRVCQYVRMCVHSEIRASNLSIFFPSFDNK